MPTDRPSDAEVLAEALWLSRLLLSEPLYQGNGEESEVAEQAGQFLRQVADRLSAPSSEEDAKRYQTAPSVSSAGAGDTQIAEDAGGWRPIDSAPKDMRVMLFRPSHLEWARVVIGSWVDERYQPTPKPYWTHDRERLAGKLEARSCAPTHWRPLPTPPAQGKPE